MGVIYKNLGFLGFPLYEVGSDGSVVSLKWRNSKERKELKPSKTKNGYLSVYLSDGKNHYVHRLVAMAFIPNPLNFPIINHKDENKQNNNVSNLEWCTVRYNRNYGGANERTSNAIRNHKKISTPIRQYSRKGDFIKEYPSIMEAHRQSGLYYQNIVKCCNHDKQYAHCGGYIWRFKNDETPIEPLQMIVQTEKDGNIVGEYETIKEAAKATGISNISISQCLNGRSKSAGGFIWKRSQSYT